MTLFIWVIIGGIAGYLASLMMRTNSEQGPLMDVVLGVIGALVGGYLMNLFGAPGVNGLNLYSIAVAVLGSITLIWLGRMLGESRA